MGWIWSLIKVCLVNLACWKYWAFSNISPELENPEKVLSNIPDSEMVTD